MPINVALVDFRASPAPAVELATVAAALTRQGIEHFAVPPPNGWGIAASVTSGPPSTVQPGEWVLGLFDHPDQPGALGYHDRTPHGQPLMKVFPALCEQDGVKWSSCASHELLETLADPECALGAQAKTGRFWALEVCDAVEADSYDIDGVTVSNFVTPAYFQPPTSRKGVKLDHLGLVHTPFALRPGGYNQVFEPGQGWVQKTADQVRAYRASLPGRRRARTAKFNPLKENTMQGLTAFIASGTGRRLLVFLVGLAVVVLNKKLGLDLDATAVTADVTLVLGYVVQSAAKEASDNHADARVEAAKVVQPLAPPVITPAPAAP